MNLTCYINETDFDNYFLISKKYNFGNYLKRKIGVLKIIEDFNQSKKFFPYIDFSKKIKIEDKPDIIRVKESTYTRNPETFIKIKNTSENDRWVGLTEEQFNTIKRSAGNKTIYMIYASIRSETINNNPKTTDLTGMFLKEMEDKNKSEIFQKFANLNAECRIEFIISSKDLSIFAYPFERGMNMYETNLFEEKRSSSFYSKDGTRKDVLSIEEYKKFNGVKKLEIEKGFYPEKDEISEFKIKGTFKLIHKRKKSYIECISDVSVENSIFGKFYLEKNKFYKFNLVTLGRDPKLKRNNLFISKKRIYQLIEEGKIRKPEIIVEEIVERI
ncbi:hypothetical protein A2316_04015 [Candidatus Falkowbacteria bacterium RIFOXYB2_FULL_38_15]|uniref:Uncharacterized protein n=1 Tax=Candidatus Falkowbacteria bacterium RIFOXYA2_FULL_38_12 TaxID=1797993 RepID=A0A1F5S3B9_9BACT|nr:MAG: hypothetical protein A2257_01135 [Candidatus Falkowbacteria bacterium RIFOXYA2_FULL_38_12]OGF33580.1 MAG: hypothetical protein A2316_04015 [Candidatus Falkowbacteria bacterium RIFOXYB2_FULL_38_15]OGF42601.1 MAG: hypothetical protein A2555_03710 [Candidatus Falkowbacteria bacterium RIFOXYD2_FULL_39_16]